ncbi:MAG: hypothetical protein ABI885_02565 [Gammaproteobacteria bacterium]
MAALLCAASPLALAKPLLEQLRTCAAETEDARRLACYDREVGSALKVGEASMGAPAAPPPPVVAKLQAHVTKLAEQTGGKLVFTLDNGQVWRQSESTPPPNIKQGETVTITPGALGSFWLVGESRRSIRVKRTQ